jgi:8-oxo-dGTP diphosphatase
MELTPKVGVGVIVVKDKRVLLGKRKGSHGAGAWSFPGGHLEFGESWEQCALRETEEETGIKISNLSFITATNDVFAEERRHYVTIYLKGEYQSGELTVMEPEKCERWEWFAWDALPEPLFIPVENFLRVMSGKDMIARLTRGASNH